MPYIDIILILIPLCAGYLVKVRRFSFAKLFNRALHFIIFLILFFMGASLADYPDLLENLKKIGMYSFTFLACILIVNFVIIALVELKLRWKVATPADQNSGKMHVLFDTIKLCGIIILGYVAGSFHGIWIHYTHQVTQAALSIMLFIVGVQLRNSGMTLRQIILNKYGVTIALMGIISSLIGGAIAASLLKLPVHVGMAVASGFGWYSLSSVIISNILGPVLGSSAFFTDLGRELLTIIMIPIFINRHPGVTLSISGATSLEFTLPMLQQRGGSEMIAPAIANGFIITLLAPLLMGWFCLH